MNKTYRNAVLFLLFFVVSCFSLYCFQAQGADSDKIKEIRSRLVSNSQFVAYKAFRKNDLDICNESNDRKSCGASVKTFLSLKKIATGKCGSISSGNGDFYNLCEAITANKCAQLDGYQNFMCQGFVNSDPALLAKAYSCVDIPEPVENRNRVANYYMGIYAGFKNGSESACAKFSKNNLLDSGACNMIFGSQSFGSSIDALSMDIAMAISVKASGKTSLCSSISNHIVRGVCENTSIKDESGVFSALW